MQQKTKTFSWLFIVIFGLSWGFIPTSFAAEDEKELLEKLDEKYDKRDDLSEDLSKVNSSLSATQAAINRVQNLLSQTAKTIDSKNQEIVNLENQQRLNRTVLSNLLQEIYYTNLMLPAGAMLSETDMSDLIKSGDNLFLTQEKVQNLISDINEVKGKISEEKVSLEDAKDDHEALLAIQSRQKQGLVAEQNEVSADLAETEESIAELEGKLAKLRNELTNITGKSYSKSDIKEAIELASKKTGVKKGVLYGILDQETGFARNTGQCNYKDLVKKTTADYKAYGKKHKWDYKPSVARLEKRYDLYQDIVKSLGYSESKKVSCTISFAAVGPNQGGAMGVAQFMSDTWNGYVSQVRSATGHSRPDPWSLTDGVMAMAIKVKNSPGGTSDSESAIRKIVRAYYGGPHAGYEANVINWSKNYKKLFEAESF